MRRLLGLKLYTLDKAISLAIAFPLGADPSATLLDRFPENASGLGRNPIGTPFTFGRALGLECVFDDQAIHPIFSSLSAASLTRPDAAALTGGWKVKYTAHRIVVRNSTG